MSSKTALRNQQRDWAGKASKTVDARDYLSTVEANLRQPLSARALNAFKKGSGSELKDTKRGPAKMKALHSSSALVVNVFDYWTARDTAPLALALKIRPIEQPIRFEAKFPTGLEGEPPNLDLAITVASGLTYALECKFSEWLTRKSPKKAPFKAKYFAPSPALWRDVTLPACQELADKMQRGERHFFYLNAAQLLKHALGLATQLLDNFSLWYLYYDWPGPEAEKHREEITQFDEQVGSEIRLRTLTYQELFRRLCVAVAPSDAAYIDYLRGRYFPSSTE